MSKDILRQPNPLILNMNYHELSLIIFLRQPIREIHALAHFEI